MGLALGLGLGPTFAGRLDYVVANAETTTLLAAMSVQPDDARKAQIDTLVGALKSASVWNSLDLLYVMAAHDAQAARVNWKSPGTFDLVAVNSPTFTADRGYAGDGASSRLRTQYTPSTNAVQYALNNAHHGVWSRTNAQSNSPAHGARTTSTTNQMLLTLRSTTNVATYRVNSDGNDTTPASTDSTGHFVARRTASNAVALFKNGSSVDTGAQASTALPTVELVIGALNTGGTVGAFNSYQIAASHVGASLTNQNISDLYAALSAYMTSVGAA